LPPQIPGFTASPPRRPAPSPSTIAQGHTTVPFSIDRHQRTRRRHPRRCRLRWGPLRRRPTPASFGTVARVFVNRSPETLNAWCDKRSSRLARPGRSPSFSLWRSMTDCCGALIQWVRPSYRSILVGFDVVGASLRREGFCGTGEMWR
jgi:hypothetical protein